MTKQTAPMKFNPTNGLPFIEKQLPNKWRTYWPDRPWNYNPWNGMPRQPDDIAADPQGRFVAQPAEAA